MGKSPCPLRLGGANTNTLILQGVYNPTERNTWILLVAYIRWHNLARSVAQRCCFWETDPISPCCFIFPIKSVGLSCRVPSTRPNPPTFHFTAWQFFSWIIPPCKTLKRKRQTDTLNHHTPKKEWICTVVSAAWCQEATSCAQRESPAPQLSSGETTFWNKSSRWLFPCFTLRFLLPRQRTIHIPHLLMYLPVG